MRKIVQLEEIVCDFCMQVIDESQVRYVYHGKTGSCDFHRGCAEHIVTACTVLGINAQLNNNRTGDPLINNTLTVTL